MIKKRKCYNCTHRGNQFKIGKLTHMHCEHPKWTKEYFYKNDFSPWDTLMVFSDTCKDHEFKIN